jgi:thioester reductase-like protein
MVATGHGGLSLVTGFPGFIGARLLPRLLELHPRMSVRCLVQKKFLDLARRDLERLAADPAIRGRIGLVVGDITLPRLGLADHDAGELRSGMTAAFHLAAVYDLAVSRDLGLRVNVEGTRNVLAFIREAKAFERLHYVSTAYVSGRAQGVFRETDLDVGQSFRNHYEETKFLAEVEVVRSGVPATVYRPGVVVGDSRTGETAKFDGPYFALTAMSRLPSGVFLRVGSGRHPINLVPVDFVIEALARLSADPASGGKTYHLADPDPLPVAEVVKLFAGALGKRFVYVPFPMGLARRVFAPRRVQSWLGMPVEAIEYFDHPCRYDTAQATADLGRLGVACPHLPDYVGRLVEFYKAQKDRVRREAMA